MNNYYIHFIIFYFSLFIIQACFISFEYSRKLVLCFLNQNIDWNPNTDRIKLLMTTVLFIAPFFLMDLLIKHNSSDPIFNYFFLTLISLITISNIWFDVKKVASLKFTRRAINDKTEIKTKNDINTANLTKENSTINDVLIEPKNFDYFYEAVTSTPLFNKKIGCFNINNFIDYNEIIDKDTNVTEIRSIQYLYVFYIEDFLNQNIKSEIQNEQFSLFNKNFTPRYRGTVSMLTSSNWSDFQKQYYKNYKKSPFYIQLSKELQIKLSIKS